MKFSYKAKNSEGKIHTGTAEAFDRFELAKNLKEKGDTLISIEKEETPSNIKTIFARLNAVTGRIKLKEKIFFARNLAAMLSAGLSLSRALAVAERQTRNQKFKQTIVTINESIQHGRSFSEALNDFPNVFSKLFISMVRAGEESGRVAMALQTVAKQMEQSYELRRRVRGAMTYPSIVLGVMIIVGVLLMVFVVPTLTETFVELNVKLPATTQLIISVSDFMKNNMLTTLVGLVGAVVGLMVAFRRPKSRRVIEFVLMRTPVIKGLIQETNAAHTGRTLASLLSAGVEVVAALGITKDVIQNSYYREVVAQAEEAIQKGKPISEAFLANDKLYPVLFSEMIAVGEEVGNIADMLEQIALFYESEVEQKTKNLSTIIEPVLMVIIGSVVGFFAVSMISPIYSLSSAI